MKTLKNILSLLAVVALSPVYIAIAVSWFVEERRYQRRIKLATRIDRGK
jgi:hypothetical protein